MSLSGNNDIVFIKRKLVKLLWQKQKSLKEFSLLFSLSVSSVITKKSVGSFNWIFILFCRLSYYWVIANKRWIYDRVHFHNLSTVINSIEIHLNTYDDCCLLLLFVIILVEFTFENQFENSINTSFNKT